MSERVIEIKEVVQYGGHNQQASGAVNVTFVADYSELANSIMVTQLLNNDVTVAARVPGGKPFKIGIFRVKNVIIDGDGDSKIKLNGLCDYIEMDALNRLPLKSDENPRFTIMMKSEVEIEDEEDDDW